MTNLLTDSGIVLALLLIHGFLAMAGSALMSCSRSVLRDLAAAGNRRAQAAQELVESPERFLPAVRGGMTLAVVVAAVVAGVRFSGPLAGALARAGFGPVAVPVAFSLIVVALAFLAMVVGETGGRRVGRSYAVELTLAVAPILRRFAGLTRVPMVAVDRCATILLGLLRVRTAKPAMATEEDIAILLREGSRAGAFHEREPEMVEGVLALDRLQVRELMTPRTRMIWVNVNDNHMALWHKIVVSGHSQFPVYENTRDNVLGIVSLKAIYANTAAGVPLNIRDLVTPPLFAPETLTATSLLETFRKAGKYIALVTDEFGGIAGTISLHDIMEAIVGDLPSMGDRSRPTALKHDNGAWLVDGMLDTESFAELVPDFDLPDDAGREYQTVAGFVMKHLARMPAEGESFVWSGYEVRVLDLDGFRIDKLLLVPVASAGKPAAHPLAHPLELPDFSRPPATNPRSRSA